MPSIVLNVPETVMLLPASGFSFQWGHHSLPFPLGKILLNPPRITSNVPSSMNTPTPPKQNYTLHSNSPAAIIAFRILFCDDFSMCLPPGLWTPQGKDPHSFILPVGSINYLKWMDEQTDGWRFTLENSTHIRTTTFMWWGWKMKGRSSCDICCKPFPLPSSLQYSIPSLSSSTY